MKGFYQTSGLTFDQSFNKFINFLIGTFSFMLSSYIIKETYLRRGFSYIFKRTEVYEYMEATFLCDFGSKIVRVQAALLTKDTKEKTISAMLLFLSRTEVNKSVHDLSWLNRKASDFLERGSGVCADRTITFAALLRSVKIPARVVEGYHKGSAHGWTEIYYWGAWRTLDPSNISFLQSRDAIIPEGPYKGETYLEYFFDGDFFFSDEYANLMKHYDKRRVSNTNAGDPFHVKWYDDLFYGGGA